MVGQPKKPSRPAPTSYDVGKYKPPVEHRFKPGNKGGGRKKGSKNKDHFDDLLDQKVVIGHDSVGRPIRKTWRKIIDLQLLKMAAERNLGAMKLVKDFELKRQALKARLNPGKTEAEVRDELAEQSKPYRDTLIEVLDNMAGWKWAGILGDNDEADRHPIDEFHGHGLAAWVYEAMMDYRQKLGEPRDPGPWQAWRPFGVQSGDDARGDL